MGTLSSCPSIRGIASNTNTLSDNPHLALPGLESIERLLQCKGTG